MRDKSFGQSDPNLIEYAHGAFKPEDDVLKKIREDSVAGGLPDIQVGSFDGLHLEMLARAAQAKKAVEIGTLGGYSGTCLLRGMGEQGKLYTFEISPQNAEIALQNFETAGVRNQVELILGPASDNLAKISDQGPFDLVFIDADKVGYPAYYEWAVENLRVGGLILGDNTFGFGKIHNDNNPSIEALRKFNDLCANGDRTRATMLPTGEGLTFAVKVK